jgi:hypothetical protein
MTKIYFNVAICERIFSKIAFYRYSLNILYFFFKLHSSLVLSVHVPPLLRTDSQPLCHGYLRPGHCLLWEAHLVALLKVSR